LDTVRGGGSCQKIVINVKNPVFSSSTFITSALKRICFLS
jgi:hypothetical protein